MIILRSIDKSVLITYGFVFLLLLAASIALQTDNFFRAPYLLQQFQTATFLGIIASGTMIVILLGHIDLSIPWIVTAGGMMSTAAAGWWDPALAIPFGLFAGLAFGLLNGIGVAFLRIPSMIFTLGVNTLAQGLMVLHTGGFAPQDYATDLMRFVAVDRSLGGFPGRSGSVAGGRSAHNTERLSDDRCSCYLGILALDALAATVDQQHDDDHYTEDDLTAGFRHLHNVQNALQDGD